MPTRAFLTTGETDLPPDMTVDLMHVADGDALFMIQNTWHMPPPKPDDKERTITMELLMSGKNTALLLWKRERVQALLSHAERTLDRPDGSWDGEPVKLWLAMLDSEAFIKFDVKRGTLEDKQREYAAGNLMRWLLTLTCLPYGRGPMTDLGLGFVRVTNAAPTLWVQRVPGDAPPLVQIEYRDDTIGDALNAIRQGRRSLRGMQQGDFTFPAPVIAQSPGTTATDTSALNGGSTPRLATTNTWQTLGIARVPAGRLNAQRADLRLRFKASTALLGAPNNLAGTVVLSTGSLQGDPTGYIIVVAEGDGSGHRTIGSDPITVAFPGDATGEIQLTWDPVGAPPNHRVYFYSPVWSPFWRYFDTHSSAGSYTFSTTAGATVGDPPTATDASLIPPELRLSVALDVASPVWSPPGPPFVPQNGGNTWEFGYGGTFRCPPLGRQEGGTDRGYLVRVEVRSQGTAAATLSADALYPWPHDEPQCYAAEPSMDRAAPVRWVLDTRRDGLPSALQTDFGSPATDIGFVPAGGSFTAGEGGNLLLFAFEGRNGAAGAALAASVRAHFTPRYVDLTGVIA